MATTPWRALPKRYDSKTKKTLRLWPLTETKENGASDQSSPPNNVNKKQDNHRTYIHAWEGEDRYDMLTKQRSPENIWRGHRYWPVHVRITPDSRPITSSKCYSGAWNTGSPLIGCPPNPASALWAESGERPQIVDPFTRFLGMSWELHRYHPFAGFTTTSDHHWTHEPWSILTIWLMVIPSIIRILSYYKSLWAIGWLAPINGY